MGGNTKQAANDRSRRGRAGTPGRGLHSARAAARTRPLDETRRVRGPQCGARGGRPRPQQIPAPQAPAHVAATGSKSKGGGRSRGPGRASAPTPQWE